MVRIEPEPGFVGSASPTPVADLRVCAARTDAGWRDARAVITDSIEWIAAAAGVDDPFLVQPSLRGEMANLARSMLRRAACCSWRGWTAPAR